MKAWAGFVAATAVLAAASPAYALSWTCPKCGQTWPFDPRDSAHRDAFAQRHMAACTAGGGGGGGGGDPMIDAMAPLMQGVFNQIGQELARSIFGDPAEDARIRELERQRQEAERLEAERRAAAAAREREARHRRLMDALGLKEEGSGLRLGPDFDGNRKGLRLDEPDGKTLSVDDILEEDDGLRPQGTSFFGLGGGEDGAPAPHNDPMVVDLRRLRQGAYLAQAAENAGPEDAALLQDEALRLAEGRPPTMGVPPDDKLPPVDEKGLKAFQEANNAERRARDSRESLQRKVDEAKARFDRAGQEAARRKADLERRMAAADEAEREALRRQMAELLKAHRAEWEAWGRIRSELEAGKAREGFAHAAARQTLREISVPSPVSYAGILRKEREWLEPAPRAREDFVGGGLERRILSWGTDGSIGKDYGFVNDPARQAALDRLVERLRQVSPYPDQEIQIRIVDLPKDSKVEAGVEGNVSAIGNRIYVGRKYLERTPPPTRDEMLFVLGHEIGHLQREHAHQGMGAKLRQELKETLTRTQDDLDLDETGLTPLQRKRVMAAAENARWKAEFTRPQESEADRYGASLALAAGAKPEGMRQAFLWMKGLEDAAHARNPTAAEAFRIALIHDHPHPGERFQDLRKIFGRPLGEPLP